MSIFEKAKVKSENIMIRVTPDQKAAILNRAKTQGMTVSEYLLSLCGKDIEQHSWIDRNGLQKTISDLHRMVESAGYDWSVEELCRQVFIAGINVFVESYSK